MGFEAIGGEKRFEGKMITAGVERYRHGDGAEVTREKVWHPGAAGILAVDQTTVWLTRQPREVIDSEASLEIPAGKLDVDGETPLETAQRELSEEIGRRAASWDEVATFYSSPGFTDERVWLYLATDLSEEPDFEPDEHERIEIVPWPLERIDEAIAQCEDAKSLVGLLWLGLRLAPVLAAS